MKTVKSVHFNVQTKGQSFGCTKDSKSVQYRSNLYVWQPYLILKNNSGVWGNVGGGGVGKNFIMEF
jgi:hypothetical protein